MKDGVPIITAENLQTIMPLNPRFDIDSSYSLVILSVNLNDSSSNYHCVVYVTNPRTGSKQEVKPDRKIPLTLNIVGMYTRVVIILV